jgi:uncharacterized protein
VLAEEEGRTAVVWARASVGAALLPPTPRLGRPVPESPTGAVFGEPRGVFVTLKEYPSGDLRGCIGYPLPVLPLATAIARAAVAAATEDPRFPRVRASEVEELTVEVSVLTVPVPVGGRTPEEIVAGVRVGRDGLIVEGHGTSGLLLPQIAPEQGWSSEEFLNGTCEKAGLRPGAWREPGVQVRRFEAEVFAERSPGGTVERVPI